MFNKILFATTASPTCDNAAKVAFDLELKWDAKLCVFHVLGIPSRGYSAFVTDARTGELAQPDPDYIDWVKEEMKNTYDVLLADTDDVSIEAAVGVPHREILRKARKDDVELLLVSGFRSVDYQAGLIRNKLNSGQRIEDILQVNVAPGFSQHHTGRAIDLATPGYKPLLEEFEESAAFAWLQEYAAKFGFAMSYPRNNPEGIIYEPWHWYRAVEK